MNPREIYMESVLFSSFLDTVAATHDQNRFQRELLSHRPWAYVTEALVRQIPGLSVP